MALDYYIKPQNGPGVAISIDAPMADYEGSDVDTQSLLAAVAGVMQDHFKGDWKEAQEAFEAHRDLAKQAPAPEDGALFDDLPLMDEKAVAWESFLTTAQDAVQGIYEHTPLCGGAAHSVGLAVKIMAGADATPVKYQPKQNYTPPIPPPGL